MAAPGLSETPIRSLHHTASAFDHRLHAPPYGRQVVDLWHGPGVSFTSTPAFTTWTAAQLFDLDSFLFQVQPRHLSSALHCSAAAVVTNATGSTYPPAFLDPRRCDARHPRHSQDLNRTTVSSSQILMSPRVTRSTARLSAAGSSTQSPAHPPTAPTARAPPSTRKRKAPARETSPAHPAEPEPARPSASRRTKRAKVDAPEPPAPAPSAATRRRKGSRADTAMSSSGYDLASSLPAPHQADKRRPSSGPSEEKSNLAAAQSSTRRKSGRKKDVQGAYHLPTSPTPTTPQR